jgi:hypothetical protein
MLRTVVYFGFIALFGLLSCESIEAGVFHRRCRPRHAPCVPKELYGESGTVEQMATSIVQAALALHQQSNVDPILRTSLLNRFQFQIGPIALQPQGLSALLNGDNFVDRVEIQQFVFGELRDIAARLQAR